MLPLWTAAVGILAGCPQTELTGRYRHASFREDSADKPRVKMSTGVTGVPRTGRTPSPPILLSLNEKGQMAYVRAAKEAASSSAVPPTTDTEKYLKLLRAPIAEKASSASRDRLLLSRRIVVVLEKTEQRQADRVVAVRLKLEKLTGGEFAAIEWGNPNKLAVDLGKVTRTHYDKFIANVTGSLPIPAAPAQAGATYETKTEVTEEVELADAGYQFSTFGADQAYFGVTAPVGIDLAGGGYTIDVTVRLKTKGSPQLVVEFDSLRKKDGAWINPNTVKFGLPIVKPIDASKSITATLTGHYQLRSPYWAEGTVQEGDDCVTFYSGEIAVKTANPLEIVTQAELGQLGKTYLIREGIKGGALLNLVVPPDDPVPIRLGSRAEAWEFIQWWYAHRTTTIGGFSLKLGNAPLTTGRAGNLRLTYDPE